MQEPGTDQMPAPPALACSLAPAALESRKDEIDRLLSAHLIEQERVQGAVRLRFRPLPAVREAVADLVRRERECCPFLGFALEDRADSLVLQVSAPEPVDELLGPFLRGGAG